MEIVFAAGNAIDIQKTHIEPYGRIKCSVLIDAEPGQLVVENLGILVSSEVAVFSAPIGNRFSNPMYKLFY